MKLEIEDAFVSAFTLKHHDTVEYFLKNGINIDDLLEDSIINLCYSLEYLPDDPPLDIFQAM